MIGVGPGRRARTATGEAPHPSGSRLGPPAGRAGSGAAALVLAVLVLLAGCGDGDGGAGDGTVAAPSAPADSRAEAGDEGPDGDRGALAFGLRRCPAEPELVTADPSRYRDQPVYVGNEMPTDEVRAWAVGQPGFQGIWIDRDNFGWLAVAFDEGAEQRQGELEQRFPGVGVVAVHVDWTAAELDSLQQQAFDALQAHGVGAGGGSNIATGLVSVSVGELTRERLEPLAPLAGPRLCVEGVDPGDVVRPGPQPDGGDGWRLLGLERTGSPYRTGVATGPDQYARLWAEAGLRDARPEVDFDDAVVVWFGAVYGSGCEIRLEDVVVDGDRRLVHGRFVVPGSPTVCPDDANPEAYVVAPRPPPPPGAALRRAARRRRPPGRLPGGADPGRGRPPAGGRHRRRRRDGGPTPPCSTRATGCHARWPEPPWRPVGRRPWCSSWGATWPCSAR